MTPITLPSLTLIYPARPPVPRADPPPLPASHDGWLIILAAILWPLCLAWLAIATYLLIHDPSDLIDTPDRSSPEWTSSTVA